MRSLLLPLAKAMMSPPVPAGTMAALAVLVPVGALSVDTPGRAWPAGHVVTYPSGLPRCGSAVMLKEYACAALGIPHVVAWRTGKLRCCPLCSAGPPSGPVVPRVSTTRQGDTGKKA